MKLLEEDKLREQNPQAAEEKKLAEEEQRKQEMEQVKEKQLEEEKEEEKPVKVKVIPSRYISSQRMNAPSQLNEEEKRKIEEKKDQLSKQLLAIQTNNQKNNNRYKEMQQARTKLPAYTMRQQILQMLANNQVIVISGETGCGKTTQVLL